MKKQKKKIENKTKKALPKALKITFGLLLYFVLLGGIGIGIYYLIKAITVRWFIFVALIPIIPFGIANLKRLVFRKDKHTVEQNKQANVKVCIYTLFYWLCDLFYMSFLIDNITCKFIFGGLIMLIIFMNLVRAFTYPKGKTGFERWGLLQDFLIGVGLSIYLIYIIPNANVKEVLIPVIAAVYGGLITLVGVAWTIKKSDRNIRLENRLKIRPIIIIIESHSNAKTSGENYKVASIKEDINQNDNLVFVIKNIAPMPCRITGVNYLNKIIECADKHLWVENQEKVRIFIQVNDFKYDGTIELLLEDIAGNQYEYLLTYDSIGYITSTKDVTDIEGR